MARGRAARRPPGPWGAPGAPCYSGGSVMGALVVGPEEVGAEVVPGIAPHGMDVVGVVLGVVVLDEERGPVQAVVVGLSRGERAGPGEEHAPETGLVQAAQFLPGQL